MNDWPPQYHHVFSRLDQDKLRTVGPQSWTARCPSHDDRSPSLTLKVAGEGTLLVKCHRNNGDGCPAASIVAALGLGLDDLFPDNKHYTGGRPSRDDFGTLELTFPYRDREGKLVFQVCRYRLPDGSKAIRQRRPNTEKIPAWLWNLNGVHRPLYRLPELLRSFRHAEEKGLNPRCAVVEGEKAAEALWSAGVPATCNSGGAGKWHLTDHQDLRGVDCVVLPDNDPQDPVTKTWTGQDHAEGVCKSLFGFARTVRYVDLPGLPVKGDAYDWVRARRSAGIPDRVTRSDFWDFADSRPVWLPPDQPHPLFAAASQLGAPGYPGMRQWKDDVEELAACLSAAKTTEDAAKKAAALAAAILAGAETFLGMAPVPRSLPPAEPKAVAKETVMESQKC